MSRTLSYHNATPIIDVGSLPHSHYHANLTADERSTVQRKWSNGDISLIVATIAFGMVGLPTLFFVSLFKMIRLLVYCCQRKFQRTLSDVIYGTTTCVALLRLKSCTTRQTVSVWCLAACSTCTRYWFPVSGFQYVHNILVSFLAQGLPGCSN